MTIYDYNTFVNEGLKKSMKNKNPLLKLKNDKIPIKVEELREYIKKLKFNIEKKFNIKDLNNYENIYQLDPNGNKDQENLLTEYEDILELLDEIYEYGHKDSEIISDDIFEKEIKEQIEEEIERLKIPNWLKLDVKGTIKELNNYDIIQYKGETFYIR